MDTLDTLRQLINTPGGGGQAVELVRSLGDPDVVEALLEGTTLYRYESGWDHLVPSGRLRLDLRFANQVEAVAHALLAIVGPAETPTVAALRRATNLSVNSRDPALPVDLDWLATLPELERLDVDTHHVKATGAPEGFPKLVELRLDAGLPQRAFARFAGAPIEHVILRDFPLEREAPFAWLTTLPRLRVLTLELWKHAPTHLFPRLDGVQQLEVCEDIELAPLLPMLPSLRVLRLPERARLPPDFTSDTVEDLESGPQAIALGPMPALRRLVCRPNHRAELQPPLDLPNLLVLTGFQTHDTAFLAGAPRLEHLELRLTHTHEKPRAVDLGALGGMPGLRRLGLHGAALPHLADLPLPPAVSAQLEHLAVDHAGLSSLDGLDRFPNLVRLGTRGARLRSLAGIERCPKLRVLDLRECTDLTDLRATESLDLRAIFVHGTRLGAKDFPEPHRWAVRHDRHPNHDAWVDHPLPRRRRMVDLAHTSTG